MTLSTATLHRAPTISRSARDRVELTTLPPWRSETLPERESTFNGGSVTDQYGGLVYNIGSDSGECNGSEV